MPPAGLGDALGHLQEAALSMVAAARSALDAAERLARDPVPLIDIVAHAARAARPPASARIADADADADADSTEPPRPAPRVQHVVVAPPGSSVGESHDGAGDGQGPR